MGRLRRLKNNILGAFLLLAMFVVATVFCWAPTILYFLAKYAFSPNGFWQQFVLAGAFLAILGPLQLVLGIVWIAFIVVFLFG